MTTALPPTLRVAVIGGGISGLSAAWGLNRVFRHVSVDVTLFEAADRLGGHTATVDVDYDGVSIPVDTGFIVYNELNYPQLTRFFAYLGVETEPSDMSFAVSIGGGRLEWAGHEGKLWKLFAQPTNAVDPRFWWMLREIMRFNRVSTADKASGALAGVSLGEYLTRRGFSARFQTDYLVPMGAAIWSTAVDRMLDFPAETFVTFFDNHRLLGFDRPQWRTVTGGSRRYIEKLKSRLPEVRLSSPARQVTRSAGGVDITLHSGEVQRFDHVILASHSDQSLEILGDADPEERAILSAIRYQANDVYLHRDPALMPRRRAAWSSWNYLAWPSKGVDSGQHVSVTYWMNLLQTIDRTKPLFVSLNPPFAPDERLTFGRFSYAHPQLDGPALAAQKRLTKIQGRRNTHFAGAWTRYGFHEDGLMSGLAAARHFGADIPWEPPDDVVPLRPVPAQAAE